MEYGLALSGGGAKGAAHAGVLLALEEEGLLPAAIGGTSAGSIAAGLYACGMRPEELCETVHQMSVFGPELLDPDIFGLLSFIPCILMGKKTALCGLMRGRKFCRLFCSMTEEKHLGEVTFPLLIPAVDLKTGYTVCFTNYGRYFDRGGKRRYGENGTSLKKRTGEPGKEQSVLWMDTGRVGDIMMASSSVPGVFCPFYMEGMYLVDGGVTNNLPVELMRTAGCGIIAAVDIGSDYEGLEESSVFEILSHSFSLMSLSLKDCRSEGECVLLKPSLPPGAGLLDFDKMEACMEAAYRYTKKESGRIRRALRQHKFAGKIS